MISRSALVKAAAKARGRDDRLIRKHLTREERRWRPKSRQVALANEREGAARLAAEASDGAQGPTGVDAVAVAPEDGSRRWQSVASMIDIEALAADVSEEVDPTTATPELAVRGSKRR